MYFTVEDFTDEGLEFTPEELADYDPEVIAPLRVIALEKRILSIEKLLTFPDLTTADRKAWEGLARRVKSKYRYYIAHHRLPVSPLQDPIMLPDAGGKEGKALAGLALALPIGSVFATEWMAEVQVALRYHRTIGILKIERLGGFRTKAVKTEWNRGCNSMLEEWKTAHDSSPSFTAESLCAQLSTT